MRWAPAGDSLTVCPAGDSVIVNDPQHLHASRLRIGVEYFDENYSPRVKVPPDSIRVTYAISSGNLLVNDQAGFIAPIAIQVPLGPAAARPAPADRDAAAPGPAGGGVLALVAPPAPDGRARLAVFDLTGRRIAVIVGRSGSTLVWDGRDEQTRSPVSTGIYFYRMEAGDHRRDGKVAVVR